MKLYFGKIDILDCASSLAERALEGYSVASTV